MHAVLWHSLAALARSIESGKPIGPSKLKHHEMLAAAKKRSEFRAILGSGLKYAACTTNWFGHARVELHREPEPKLAPNSRVPTISELSQVELTSIYIKC